MGARSGAGLLARFGLSALAGRAAHYRDAWGLRPDGPAMHGMVSLV
ncbi:hydroxyurea phosphotransferase, partial [Streptomyces sp. EAG2]